MKPTHRIRINLTAVNVSFFLTFGAYYSVAGLQSSLNKSVGTVSLSVLLGSMTLSALFLAPFITSALGERRSMALGTLAYSFYTIANLYPRPYTLIPGAIVLGSGGALLWVGVRGYLRAMSVRYSANENADEDATTTHFFGVFLAFLSASLLAGNFVSSLILQSVPWSTQGNASISNISAYTTPTNIWTTAELNNTEPNYIYCGVHNCDENARNQTSTQDTDDETIKDSPAIYIIFGVFAVLQILAALALEFVLTEPNDDRLSNQANEHEETKSLGLNNESRPAAKQTTLQRLAATARLNIFDNVARLLIPITMDIGVLEGFFVSQLTRYWITCYMGIIYVGYAIAACGVGSIVASYGSGLLSYVVSRKTMLVTVFVMEVATGCYLLYWEPNPATDAWMFYVIFGVYGVVYTSRKTLINASYSIFFPNNKEAANSSTTMWMATGATVAYAVSSSICNSTYIIFTLVLAGTGTFFYIAAERSRSKSRRESDEKRNANGVEMATERNQSDQEAIL